MQARLDLYSSIKGSVPRALCTNSWNWPTLDIYGLYLSIERAVTRKNITYTTDEKRRDMEYCWFAAEEDTGGKKNWNEKNRDGEGAAGKRYVRGMTEGHCESDEKGSIGKVKARERDMRV